MLRDTPGRAALVLIAFLALSVLWTWPLAGNLRLHIPRHNPGDPILIAWLLWWNTQAVPFTATWWNAPILYPLPGALALSEHLLGISALVAPIQFAGGNPLVAHNVAILLSYALSGWFAYLLGLRLTGSRAAACCAGLAFGFAPYRAGHLPHLHVLTSQWMPLVLLGLHGYVADGRTRWLVAFGGGWLLQSLSNGYYMLFLPVLVMLWLIWFVDWRRAPRRALHILIAWMLASLPLLPPVLKYREVHEALGLTRTLAEVRQFSASLGSFAKPAPLLTFWPAVRSLVGEEFLFPGATAFVLAFAGLAALMWRRQFRGAIAARSPLVFYLAATAVMWTLALGPGGQPDGPPSPLRPYSWLMWLPGYESLRVPARFAMIGALTLALAAALAFTQLAPRRRLWRAGATGLVILGLGLDGWMDRVPLVRSPARVLLPASSDLVVEIPVENPRVSTTAMYRATLHGLPLVNGYTGHMPYHYQILTLGLARGDTSVLRYLARGRALAIIVQDQADPGGGYRRMIQEIDDIEHHALSAVGPVFLLPAQPAPREEPPPLNRLSGVRRRVLRDRLVIDLEDHYTVAALEFPLRDRFKDFPGRVLVEASGDGEAWREVWLNWTGALTMDAALRDPIVAPVRIPLPDIITRYLRIYPAPEWLGDEIVVGIR